MHVLEPPPPPKRRQARGQRPQPSAGLGDLHVGCKHPVCPKERGRVRPESRRGGAAFSHYQTANKNKQIPSEISKVPLKWSCHESCQAHLFPFRILPMTSEYDKAHIFIEAIYDYEVEPPLRIPELYRKQTSLFFLRLSHLHPSSPPENQSRSDSPGCRPIVD